jgi:hypothetical protein
VDADRKRGSYPAASVAARTARAIAIGYGVYQLSASEKSSGYLAEVVELLTMALGSELAPGRGTDRPRRRARGAASSSSDEIEDRLREAVPDVTEVFLDATTSPAGRRPAGPAGTRPWTT